jgi:hypothetical protein
MSHNLTIYTGEQLRHALSNGHISQNAQVAGFAGHPNPTIASLVSSGVLDLAKMTGSLTLLNNGWGGE